MSNEKEVSKYENTPIFARKNYVLARMVEFIAMQPAIKGMRVGIGGDVADLECAQVLQEAAHRLSRVKDDELTEAYQNALNKPDSEGDEKEEKEGEDND